MLKHVFLVLLLIPILSFSGCCCCYTGSNSGNSGLGSSNTISQSVELSPIYLSGNGNQVTQQFHLNTGLTIYEIKNSGTSNFNVKLIDSSGNTMDTLVDVKGPYEGDAIYTVFW